MMQRESERITAWRTALVTVGIVLLLIGGVTFLTDVRPDNYPGVVLWLAGAIILHDGIGAMAVFVVAVVVRRVGRRIPFVILVVGQAAAAVWVIVAVLVVPEIAKRAIGTANPTILPLDYTANLLGFSIVLFALAVLAAVTALVIGRVLSSRRTS
jgi:hypothetical protein